MNKLAVAADRRTDIASALARLKEGNDRFRAGLRSTASMATPEKIKALSNGQAPFVSLLACADSRVPAEIVFDAGLGELFVCRVAGNVSTEWMVGSIEYAALALGTPLTIVMGHTKCGAVGAAIKRCKGESIGVDSRHIEKLADSIAPAVKAVARQAGSSDAHFSELVCAENARHQMREVLAHSETLRKLRDENKWDIACAVYDIESGAVRFLPEKA
jgi:carbonic anhydrase